jgi:type VI secretion system secreted protein VgrG
MALTQDGRQLKVFTPLGKDFVLLEDFSATESVSELFSYQLHLVHEESVTSQTQTIIDPKKMLGQPVATEITTRDGRSRFFHGIVVKWRQGIRRIRFTHYHAQVAPKIWLLTQKRQSRIFQKMTVPTILQKVFEGFSVKYELPGDYKARDFCVQYNETDFDFASRLMEEEGMYYFFKHTVDDHLMVVADTPQSHIDIPGKTKIPFTAELTESEFQESSIYGWEVDYQLQSGKVTLWDHNFELPGNKLKTDEQTRYSVGGNSKLEIYDYPGGYAKRYTGIDKGGGVQGELNNVFSDKELQAEFKMQSLDSNYQLISGISDVCGLTVGHKFSLTNHPVRSNNSEYMIRDLVHIAEQSPALETDDESPNAYRNEFVCSPLKQGSTPFRPMRKTPKPKIYGTQTAVVVGPQGEEIHTDKYGRVKVQFHWDREGKNDQDSSCWIRVSQPWAGSNWGTICIPRIDQEVIVEFLEGDPDRPLITGAVYNPAQMPPYELPAGAHTMGFKSNTTKGGGGYNEMVLIDGKAGELIRIHAQKDMDTTVLNDDRQLVINDRTIEVDGKRDQTIKKDMTTTVTEGHQKNTVVIGNQSNTVKAGDQSNKVSAGKQDNTVNKNISITSETGAIVIKAKTKIVLEVGANQITIDESGTISVSATNLTNISAPQNHISGETKLDKGTTFIN